MAEGVGTHSSDPGTGTAITCVAMDAARRRALSGHADGSASLWDIEGAESEATLMLHDGGITAALFTADGQLVISMDDRAVRVSELSGELSEVVASSPSGVMRFLALGSVDKRAVVVARSYDRRVLRVIDLDSGQLLVDVREASSGVATAACLPDGSALTLTDAGKLEIWTAQNRAPRAQLAAGLPTSSRVSVSPEGSVAVAGTPDGRVVAWDLSAASQLFEAAAHSAPVRAIAFDESENHVVSVADDGSLWLGSARSGERLAEWQADSPIACCAATSRLAAVDSGYRQHALTRAPVTIVVGTDAGAVHFITCAGLASRFEG